MTKKNFVEEVIKHKDFFTLKFRNFNTDKDSQFLIGKDIFVDEKDVVKLPADTFFVHDFIGSKVFQDENLFGIIEDVLNLPANDVYVVKDFNGNELLLPAVKEYIAGFDSENKILTVKARHNFIR